MIPYTLEELVVLLNRAAQTRHRKVLHAAPDVVAALRLAVPEAVPAPWPAPDPASVAALTGVDIAEAEDASPGTFALVRHDACRVVEGRDGSEEVHGLCPVIAVGTLAALEKPDQ